MVNQCSNPEGFPCPSPTTFLPNLYCLKALGMEELQSRGRLLLVVFFRQHEVPLCFVNSLSGALEGGGEQKTACFWVLLRYVSVSKVYAGVFLVS